MTRILGINTGFAHDPAAALISDGKIALAVEEERLDRVKFGKGFPHRAIEACLKHEGLSLSDLDRVGFNFQPWKMFATDLALNARWLFRRRASTYAAYHLGASLHPLLFHLKEAEWFKRRTGGALRVQFLDHHLCHAASAFYVSPFDEAAILTLDQRGESVSATMSVGQGTVIRRLGTVRLPDSLGMLYLSVTLHLGFHIGDEYKVMGLAPYGTPAYRDVFTDLLQQNRHGTFRLNPSYFDYLGAERCFSNKFYTALGPRRQPGEPIEQRHMDLACSLQARLTDVVLKMTERLHARTNLPNLCLAGGVAFNSVMSGALLRHSPFKQLYIQPAAGDAGTALGAALIIAHGQLGQPRGMVMEHAFLGPAFSEEEIQAALAACKVAYERPASIARAAAELLAQGQVVGWFQGRMEFGPRALGARSILADPRSEGMKDRVNQCVKHREGFRPFAPSVLEERAGDYFEYAGASPFMLFVYGVRPEKRAVIPAVTHVDGTARVQTVRRADHPLYWELISEFERLTGVPVVMNTSFNVNGEPIVCAPVDAIRCFFGSGLDALALGPFLIRKAAHAQ